MTFTGENIQWYDAASGGNLLDSNTVLTDGQMVYASQTVMVVKALQVTLFRRNFLNSIIYSR